MAIGGGDYQPSQGGQANWIGSFERSRSEAGINSLADSEVTLPSSASGCWADFRGEIHISEFLTIPNSGNLCIGTLDVTY